MIDDLTLHNFQTHKKTHLKFSPGINVIIGDNDNGKSSITRALYWLFMNKPSGDEFIRWGKSNCSVSATINNRKIRREKKANSNKYVIDGSEFNAVRSDVPGELKNIAKVTSTNIQLEDDQQFLLSDSPSDVARKLNDVVGLNKIDDSIQYPNKIIRQMNSSINHIHNDIQQKQQEKEKLKNIESIEEKNNRLNKLNERKANINAEVEEIDSIIEDLEEQRSILNQKSRIEKLSKKLSKLKKHHQRIVEINNELNNIQHSIKVIKTNKSKVERLQPIQDLSNKVTELQNICEQHTEIKSHLNDMSKSAKVIKSNKEEITSLQNEVNKLRKQFKEAQHKLGVCPTCERPFDN